MNTITTNFSYTTLGALSEETGIQKVQVPAYPFPPEETVKVPGPVTTRTRTDPAVFPPWLKGSHIPSPGTYPKLKNGLDQYAGLHAKGLLDPAQEKAGTAGCHWQDSKVGVEITTPYDTGASDRVIAWMKAQGVPKDDISSFDLAETGKTIIGVMLPPSLLADLGNHTDVTEVGQGICGTGESYWMDEDTKSFGTRFGTELSEGVAVHEADHWQGTYDGGPYTIGIIDVGFEGFGTSITAGELRNVWTRCYTNTTTTTYTSNVLSDCEWNNDHGTNVAETVLDTATGAAIYISNAAVTINNEAARQRLRQDMQWMKDSGVDVIIHAVTWAFSEGAGDGEAVWDINDVQETVNLATGSDTAYDGVVWSNAAANDRYRVLRQSFNPLDPNDHQTYHVFDTDDDEIRMFILNPDRSTYFYGDNAKHVQAYIRWDDDWGGANCDIDFYLGKYRPDLPANQQYEVLSGVMGATHQSGGNNDKPYEEVIVRTAPPGYYYVLVRRFNCTETGDLDYLQITTNSRSYPDYHTPDKNIGIPADSLSGGLISVGAAGWDSPNWVRNYSSRGPTLDGRTKPDALGADCGSTSREPYVLTETYPCGFSGTSQAAAHMGGLAMLVRDRFPHLNSQQVVYYLKENTPERSNPDNAWGEGFVKLPDLADTVKLKIPPLIAKNQSVDVTVNSTGTFGRITLRANGLDSEGKAYFNQCSSGNSDSFGHIQGSCKRRR